MATIPLQIASRSLETGTVVQYPGGGEIGRAMQSAGGELQEVAAAYQARQDQQDRFDAGVVDDELRQRMAQVETDAANNAPADGSGIHDSVYGQLDPKTGQPVKPGIFDQIFAHYAQKVPASQRARFTATEQAMRLAGSNRLAQVQHSQRQAYEQVEITKQQDSLVNSILTSDPNDRKTFEAWKQSGFDRIASSGMDALDKEKAAAAWEQKATKGLFQAMLTHDPSFAGRAREALGLAPVEATGGSAVDIVTDKIIGVESGGDPNAKNPNSSASGVGQFLDSTWVATVRQHRPDIAAGKSAAQIIALKGDKALGREMVKAYQQDNADYLANRGLPTTRGNIYLAHFLGPAGATAVLKADPDTPVINIVGQDVVNANPFLRGMTAAETAAWAAKKMGGASGGRADPRFAGLAPEDRLALANQADAQNRQQETQAKADATAAYTAYKDRFELGIVDGSITDPALIHSDKTLNDGDKASLLRSFNEQNKGAIQVAADLTALQGNSLSVDPYSSDDKRRVDNLYTTAGAPLPLEQRADLATAIIQQTHLPPQSIINDMRRGLSGQDPAQVIAAAQTAQKINTFDPAALPRRDGGSEVQKAANDFSYYVDKLNLSPEDAAKRMIENADPAKQRDRKALEPAAKEFVKAMGEVDLAGELKEGGWGAPALGLDPQQQAGIQANFLAIAEDQFYAANGDPHLAKNRALEQMKAIYGPSEMSGSKTIVKYPPERYWPKQESSGALLGFIGGDPLSYAKVQLYRDVDASAGAEIDHSGVRLITTPETEADVKAGRLPGYAVMWKDANGNFQTIPGKVWRPDTAGMLAAQQQLQEKDQAEATRNARQNDALYDTNILTGEPLPKPVPATAGDQPAKPQPGANIPADLPAPETSSGSAM